MTIFWAGCLSAVLSFLLVKKRRTLTKQVICNLIMLLAGCGGMLAAGMQTTSVLVYIILFVFTVLGVLTRIFAPAMLNFTGRLLAKLRKQSYNEQTYEMLLQNLPGMRSGIWLFTSIKMFLWILLTMSLLKMI